MRHPPYTHWLDPVSSRERRGWYSEWLVDGEGHPTSELARELLAIFFENPAKTFELAELADDLFLDPRHVLVLCRQLTVLNLVDEAPINSLHFRRVHQPWNVRLFQAVSERIGKSQREDQFRISHKREAA